MIKQRRNLRNVAENQNKKHNNKLILCFILFLSLFTANLCWAGSNEDNLNAEFFKAAEEIELLDNGPNDINNLQKTENKSNANDITKNNTINKVIESSKVFIDASVVKAKEYSIKLNKYAEKLVNGNKLLAKLLIISVLSLGSIIAIFLLLIIFKLLFGRKKKRQNPFNSGRKNVFETPSDDLSAYSPEENTDVSVPNTQNGSNIQTDVTVDLKHKIINEPSPTDIKSAVNLFVKITSK